MDTELSQLWGWILVLLHAFDIKQSLSIDIDGTGDTWQQNYILWKFMGQVRVETSNSTFVF